MPAPVALAAVAVFVNGNQVMLPAPAVQRGDTVLVPVKGVFDRLGATIAWNSREKHVTVTAEEMRLELTIGSPEAVLNGQALSITTPPEIVDGVTLVPLRLVATALGASIAWDQERRRVYVQGEPKQPLARATIGQLIAQPNDWAGRTVLLAGEYRGWEPSPFSPATRNGTPTSRRDWVLRDASGEIYCRGDVHLKTPFPLTPYSNAGHRLAVAGLVKVAQEGFVFLEPREIVELSREEGLVCNVSTSRRAYVEGESVRIRLKVGNPSAWPTDLQGQPGPKYDLWIKDREGREVWRLSQASPPESAPPVATLAAGEMEQIEEIWSPGSEGSPPLAPGRYTIEGSWMGVLTSYPHMIAIVPTEE